MGQNLPHSRLLMALKNQTSLNRLSFISQFVELGVAEIKSDVNGDLDKVKNVKHEAENKDHRAERTRSLKRVTERCDLNRFAGNSEGVADQNEDFKEKTFSLGGS